VDVEPDSPGQPMARMRASSIGRPAKADFGIPGLELAQLIAEVALMDSDRPNFFAGPYIDRRADVREEVGWPVAALADPDTLYIVARDTAHLVHTGSQPHIEFIKRDHPVLASPHAHALVLLGWFKGTRCVLLELDSEQSFDPPEGASFEELRPLSPLLPADEAGLLAYARALTIWG
jgi:NAD+ diphosphatase